MSAQEELARQSTSAIMKNVCVCTKLNVTNLLQRNVNWVDLTGEFYWFVQELRCSEEEGDSFDFFILTVYTLSPSKPYIYMSVKIYIFPTNTSVVLFYIFLLQT